MNPRTAWRAAVRAVETRDGCLAVRGWHLIGPGPARYGWALRYPSGKLRWLGRTRADALRVLDSVACACGEITGEPCAWRGPVVDTVRVEWMPECLRASHDAAGNRGSYPHNGSVRLRLSAACADAIVDDWTMRLA